MTVAETIKLINGIQDPTEDLNISEEDYDDLIDYYIDAVTDWFTYELNKTYTTLPTGLELILIEMVSNILNNQMQRQDLPVMDTEDSPSKQIIDSVVSSDIRERLKPYRKKAGITIMGIGTKTQYDTLMDIEEDEE